MDWIDLSPDRVSLWVVVNMILNRKKGNLLTGPSDYKRIEESAFWVYHIHWMGIHCLIVIVYWRAAFEMEQAIIPFLSFPSRLFLSHACLLLLLPNCDPYYFKLVGQDSVAGIVTRYGLDVLGNESQCGARFPTCPHRFWGPPTLLYNGYRVSFPAVRRWGRGL